jgi:ArsR family transcriptional regulator, arsenate/arsenite/antimonite-responsive transcriptional repressor
VYPTGSRTNQKNNFSIHGLRRGPDLCIRFAEYMETPLSLAELLAVLAEPTRLRILNCLAIAPLFVSDLQAILDIPQPTVSRHLKVLRTADLVRDTPIAQFVLYRLRRPPDAHGRLLAAALDAANLDPALRAERDQALERSRRTTQARTESGARSA